MFAKQEAKGRPAKGTGLSAATGDGGGRKPPKVASLISDDMTFDGNFTGDGDLHVDGRIRGDIRVAKLTLGETGQIDGNIYADAVEARGRVIGSVTAKLVRLYATAHIDGDVTHEQLSMETGAFFQGRALKLPPADSLPSADMLSLPIKAAE